MIIIITVTDSFYKKGEQYHVHQKLRWGCYVVVSEELTLINKNHAKEITYYPKRNHAIMQKELQLPMYNTNNPNRIRFKYRNITDPGKE